MSISFDGPTKVMTLSAGTVALSVRDIWSRWVDWFLTSDNSKYLPAFQQVGGDDIDESAGTKIPIYAFLMNGWKIKPQEANHTLTVSDGILLVNGGGDPFNNTSGSYVVRINYQQPVQAISFDSGGGTGGLTIDEHNQLMNTLSATEYLRHIKNKKALIKEGSVWYLQIRNDGDTDNLVKKALKDKDGNNVTDIAAGALAQELASSV